MAPFAALRPCQSVYLPGFGISGIVTEIDRANRRVKVDYTPSWPHRGRIRPMPEHRAEWFTPADVTLFYWVVTEEPTGIA